MRAVWPQDLSQVWNYLTEKVTDVRLLHNGCIEVETFILRKILINPHEKFHQQCMK